MQARQPSLQTDASAIRHDRSHYRDLDGVRGLLAVLVMLLHYNINHLLSRLTNGAVQNSRWELSVDFFFILSGLVLARSYRLRPRGWRRMAIERLFRLLPVHLTILAALGAFFAFHGLPPAAHSTAAGMAADAAGLTAYFGMSSWNGPAWSMDLEVYLPPLLAIAIPVVWRWPRPALLCTFAGLLVVDALMCWQVSADLAGWQVARGAVGLGLGGLLFALLERQLIPAFVSNAAFLLALGALTLMMLLAGNWPLLALIFPLLAVLTVVAGVSAQGIFGRGPFLVLGGLSFTIYMIHKPVGLVLGSTLGTTMATSLLGIAISIVLAALLTSGVEKPGIRLGRRLCEWLDAKSPRTVESSPAQ